MLKKRLLKLVLLALLPATIIYGQSPVATIDKGQLDKSLVNVSYKPSNNKAAKLVITKGNEKYTYDLDVNGQYPLQFGDGEYTLSVLENTSTNQYKVIKTEKINLKIDNENLVFLQPSQMVNWDSNMKAVEKAKELTKDATTNKEKASLIYNYIVRNIRYDYDKASKVQTGYIPSVDTVLDTSLGICYDYSVLYAAMLRSVGVPTKMLMGYNDDIEEYHAWNEVYLKETNEWVTIDTTYDAPNIQNNISLPMIKDANQYQIKKVY